MIQPQPLRVALIGDRGIPARYSGFSTLVEEVAIRLVADHGMDVTVYCRSQYFDNHPPQYRGVRLVYLRAPGGKSFESLLHSARALLHAAWQGFDAVLVVDPGNGPLTLPLVLRRTPFAIHTDGLGWQRSKWGKLQRSYYRWSEAVSARLATWLVCDSPAMAAYYRDVHQRPSSYLPYGSVVGGAPSDAALQQHGLEPGRYHLVVARLEPENNVDFIIDEYRRSGARHPLVYVGGARYASPFSRALMQQSDARVRCIGPVYDAELLNGLYHHCRSYLHGHEVGGTNPSLLRAMGAGAACLAIDVVFHREALSEQGLFFSKRAGHLAGLIERLESDDAEVARLSALATARAEAYYRWDAVSAGYATLFQRLAQARRSGVAPASLLTGDIYHPENFAQAALDDVQI